MHTDTHTNIINRRQRVRCMKQTMFTSLIKINKYLQYKELNGQFSRQLGLRASVFHGGGAYRTPRTPCVTYTHAITHTLTHASPETIDSDLTILINICQLKKKQSSKICLISSAYFMFINAGKKKHWSNAAVKSFFFC